MTPSLLLSSCMTLGKSLNFSELQGARGSDEDKHSPLPEDLHRPPRKIFGTEYTESRGSTSAFPSLYLMGISRRVAARHPDQDTGTCCRGLSLRIDALLYFSLMWSPSLHHKCFPRTLGLLKLDCNSPCESGSVAVDGFIFKGMLSYGTAASFTKSL